MLNIPIWIAATIAMFRLDSGTEPFLIAVLIALPVAAVQNTRRKRELKALVAGYTLSYGAPPPGFRGGATGAGWAVGAAAGDAVLGGLVGGAIDLARAAFAEIGMSEDQKVLQRRIAGLQGWTPYHGVYVLAVSLGLSWGAMAALAVLR